MHALDRSFTFIPIVFVVRGKSQLLSNSQRSLFMFTLVYLLSDFPRCMFVIIYDDVIKANANEIRFFVHVHACISTEWLPALHVCYSTR